jgi:hypothetical protein
VPFGFFGIQHYLKKLKNKIKIKKGEEVIQKRERENLNKMKERSCIKGNKPWSPSPM